MRGAGQQEHQQEAIARRVLLVSPGPAELLG
jgi:hypothetical protein